MSDEAITTVRVIWVIAMAFTLMVWLYKLRVTVKKNNKRIDRGENGSLKLILIKGFVVEALFIVKAITFGSLGVALLLVDADVPENVDKLRFASALVFIIWAVSVIIFGPIDSWIDAKIVKALDKEDRAKDAVVKKLALDQAAILSDREENELAEAANKLQQETNELATAANVLAQEKNVIDASTNTSDQASNASINAANSEITAANASDIAANAAYAAELAREKSSLSKPADKPADKPSA